MKIKHNVVALLLAVPLVAHAQSLPRPSNCMEMHEVTRGIMELRQMGIAMPAMIELTKDNPGMRQIVEEAYKIDRYMTERHQNRVASEFAERYYRGCYELYGTGPITTE